MTRYPYRAAVPYGLAATLVLVSSFVHFVRAHDYSLIRPEILIGLLCLAGLGTAAGLVIALRPRLLGPVVTAVLVTWFLDVHLHIDLESRLAVAGVTVMAIGAVLVGGLLRDHLGRIVAGVFGTILASTLLVGAGSSVPRPPAAPTGSGTPDLPVVVHLILDEHIGLAGIPDEAGGEALRERLARFYGEHGFYVFPRAYSQYVESRFAIAHALDLAAGFDETLVVRSRPPFAWRMTRNRYLAEMQRRGYRLHVYQPDYMDLCPGDQVPGARCLLYRAASLKSVEDVALSTPAKFRIATGMYLISSRLYKKGRDHYGAFRERGLGRYLPLPEWNWERTRPHPIEARSVLERLRADLAGAKGGDLFLAHLLIPHYPYVYDPACRLEPDPSAWLDATLPEWSAAFPNDAASRATRYRRYLQQVECVTRELEEVLGTLGERGLLARSVILIHGDHGSRIARVAPVAANRSRLSPADLTDNFSTLFVVRAPAIGSGSDEHPRSLTELMRHLVTEDFRSVPARPSGPPVTEVYLATGATPPFEPARLDVFRPR